MRDFAVGDKVVLTGTMRAVAVEPEKYVSGTVTRVGTWNIVDVIWNGFDRPIMMRADELLPAERMGGTQAKGADA